MKEFEVILEPERWPVIHSVEMSASGEVHKDIKVKPYRPDIETVYEVEVNLADKASAKDFITACVVSGKTMYEVKAPTITDVGLFVDHLKASNDHNRLP